MNNANNTADLAKQVRAVLRSLGHKNPQRVACYSPGDREARVVVRDEVGFRETRNAIALALATAGFRAVADEINCETGRGLRVTLPA